MSLRLYSVSSRQKLREDTQGGVKNRSNIKISFKNILSLSLFRLYYLKDGIFKVIVENRRVALQRETRYGDDPLREKTRSRATVENYRGDLVGK